MSSKYGDFGLGLPAAEIFTFFVPFYKARGYPILRENSRSSIYVTHITVKFSIFSVSRHTGSWSWRQIEVAGCASWRDAIS